MHRSFFPRLLRGLLGFFLLAGAACAGEHVSDEKAVPVEVQRLSPLTGVLGFAVVSQYIASGLVIENQGFILQPYANFSLHLFRGPGAVSDVSLNFNFWNSFHSQHTDAGEGYGRSPGSNRGWYERDYAAGLSFTFAKVLSFTPAYFMDTSPNGGFAPTQGLTLSLTLDDSAWLGAWALQPHFNVLVELKNKTGSGTREGIGYEFGIAPAVPGGPLAVTFPVAVGLGSHQFYAQNAGFGFFTAGVNLSHEIKGIPPQLGLWTVTAGASYYYLGHRAGRAFNSFPSNDVRAPHNSEWVFSGGLAISF